MEKKYTVGMSRILFILLVIIILFINFFCITGLSSEEQISLYITNSEGEQIYEITEGEYFTVGVFNPNIGISNLLSNVTIEFNNKEIEITDDLQTKKIDFKAPYVKNDKEYTIKANKNNLSSETKIIVRKITLVVDPSSYVIEENKKFSLTVTDGENPIEGVDVYIQNIKDSSDYQSVTNEKGIAILRAPEKREEIEIIANYKDIAQTEITLTVNLEPSYFEKILNNEYLPVIFAILALIAVVFFVNYRQRKAVYVRADEISNQKKMNRYNLNEKYGNRTENKDIYDKHSSVSDKLRVSSNQGSKVEEIRITRSKKQKEVVPIKTNEDKTNEILSKKKNQMNNNDHDWFEGTDDVRYEIDKLTGELDENGIDKWFEGIDELKDKIDKKVKKDKKKRDKEKD